MKNILVIDDESTVLQFFKAFLSGSGFSVITTNNVSDAYSKAFWRKIDLILLDIVFPDGNGLELLRHLKESSRTRHIPVIIVTGYNRDEYRELAAEDYAEHYIMKTDPKEEMLLKINKIISASHPEPGMFARILRW